MKRIAILLLGPLLCLVVFLIPGDIVSPAADKVLGVTLWMIAWWITEVVSISVTALVPLTFFPLLGIMPIKDVSTYYSHPIVFLFFGGFILALALEKVNLHRRIALSIINITGTSPQRVVLGFQLATAFLSMWISNTATTVVMLPIAYSVIQLLTDDRDGFSNKDRNFALCILLGIAYAANIGGTATLIGTPPNIVLAGFLESEYDYSISFLRWLLVGMPFAGIMLSVIYIVLTKVMFANLPDSMINSKQLIKDELKKLGPVSGAEKIVMVIFACAIVLWIIRAYINQIFPTIGLTDTTISLVAAFACFGLAYKGSFILSWDDTKNLPWGIIILFGGGLALANGLSQAGLIDLIGQYVTDNFSINYLVVCSLLIVIMMFMTELMSNVALVAIFAPMVAGVALGLDIEMLHILIPVAMASSCAFMLPMATPPNAIVFASGHIKVVDMAKTGIILNVISIILLILFFKFCIPRVF